MSGARHAQVAIRKSRAAIRVALWRTPAARLLTLPAALTCVCSKGPNDLLFGEENGVPRLFYRKSMPKDTTVAGSKALKHYIGSGAHARGFVFEEQGQPFQSPIAYYGSDRGWDLAPGYEREKSIFLGRKVETGCLQCHAINLNSGGRELIGEGAVACERCHGPGERRIETVQSGKSSTQTAIVGSVKAGTREPGQRVRAMSPHG